MPNINNAEAGPPLAAHITDGDGNHAVGIWDLHVYMVPDSGGWFAQGLEIDYAVQGDTIEEAKTNFENGLERSIDLHLKMDGNLKGLIQFADMGIIQEALRNRLNGCIETYSQVSFHDRPVKSPLPFDGISFLIAGADAAKATT